MPNDEVSEVRRIRHQISEECGHDVRKVAAYYREVEQDLKQSGEFQFEATSFAPPAQPAATDAGVAK